MIRKTRRIGLMPGLPTSQQSTPAQSIRAQSKRALRRMVLLAMATATLASCEPTGSPGEQPGAANNPPSQLANPATQYCLAIGGQASNAETASGAQGICETADGRSCDEWALYRGECQLAANVIEPFSYCRATSNTPVLPVPAAGAPALPESLLPAMQTAGVTRSDMPVEVQTRAQWRCMDGAVWVCPVGANLPCGEQADDSTTPTTAMSEYCAGNPDSDFLPAYVTGRATLFNWSCRGTEAVAGEQQFHADAQGYLAEFWTQLEP